MREAAASASAVGDVIARRRSQKRGGSLAGDGAGPSLGLAQGEVEEEVEGEETLGEEASGANPSCWGRDLRQNALIA